MRNFKSSDDERDSLGIERFHLSSTDFSRNNSEMPGDLVGKIDPMIDLKPRDNERMAGTDRRDREECDANLVPIDKATWEVAIDDLGKQRGHGVRIVECGR